MKPSSAIYVLLNIILFFTILIIYTQPAYGTSQLPPPIVFTLRITDVVSLDDDLNVEKPTIYDQPVFVLNPLKGNGSLKIYENGNADSFIQNLPYGEQPVTLESLYLETVSRKVRLCIPSLCGMSINGTRDKATNRFFIGLSNETRTAEKIFLDVLTKRITPEDAKSKLKQAGLDDFAKYIYLTETTQQNEIKQPIEDFSIPGEVDGKHFVINGTIFYSPNYQALHPYSLTNKTTDTTDLFVVIAIIIVGIVVFLLKRIVVKRK